MNIPNLSVLPQAFFDALARLHAGSSYIVNGFSLSAAGAGSFTINVAAGTGWVAGTYLNYAGGSATPGVASALPRYDLVRIASGAVVPSIIAGTPSATPTPPSLAAGDLLLGYAFINVATTDYTTTSFIADYTSPVTLGSGAAATPSQVFSAETTTGIYRISAGIIGWAIAGVEKMRLSATILNLPSGSKFQENSVSIQPMTTKGDLPVFTTQVTRKAVGATDHMVLAVAAAQADGLLWEVPTLGNSTAELGGNVTMAANGTDYDGPTITPAAGTYLITAGMCLVIVTNAANVAAKLWDGTNIYCTSENYTVADNEVNQGVLSTFVTTDGTKTYKMSARKNAGANTSAILAAATNGGGTGNHATWIRALRIG